MKIYTYNSTIAELDMSENVESLIKDNKEVPLQYGKHYYHKGKGSKEGSKEG